MTHKEILSAIETMDGERLDFVLEKVMDRYEVLYPDWESVSLSLPKKDPEMRKTYLKTIMEFLEKNKKRPSDFSEGQIYSDSN